eukprot:TRINITY_DN76160_c0_g1_i1.p1 TRINITY_DN76160_c0_g1~~TRINITY_DN76160_c0_g1_i1.p1  ORF type:complete len:298 (+),score=23.64 TRINITY_DN76160_c0_g1_i1:93-986(+)
MKSISIEVLRFLLQGFTEVRNLGCRAAVCVGWHRVLHDEAFWRAACIRRWPCTAAIPFRDFFKYYRSQIICERENPDRNYDSAKFDEWLLDTYLMIEVRVAEELVSLALPFRDALRHGDARFHCETLGWPVMQLGFGCDEIDEVVWHTRDMVLKTCHLWRASDGRMCLLAKNVRFVPCLGDLEHSASFDLKPARFFAQGEGSHSFGFLYSQSGANAHESVWDVGLTMIVRYRDCYEDEEFALPFASPRKPTLTLEGSFDKRSFIQDRVAPQPSKVPSFMAPFGMCDLFHLTSVLTWR